jgi:catalase
MANFNRERIPERQPHAKGGGAFGHQRVHPRRGVPARRQTEMVAHFSTVAGERGSSDTWRDPRGLRPDEVPELHPLPETLAVQQSSRPSHAVGLLDAVTGIRAPGHVADGGPRNSEDLAAHERLLQPHLKLDQRQAGTLVREVLDGEARDQLAHNVIGQVSKGVKEPVPSRVFEYVRNIDPDLGKAIEEGVRANLDQ